MITSRTGSTFLAVETRQSIIQSDSIFYAFSNLRKIKYQLVFVSENLHVEGLHAILVDNYLQKRTPLSLTDSSFVEFTIDDNSASYENRFIVILEREVKLPGLTVPVATNKIDKFTTGSYVIYPNPAENKTINIGFLSMPQGLYTLQVMNNAGQVVYKGIIKVNNSHTTNAIKLGNSIASGSYELTIIAADGKRSVQQVFVK